jgi:hypothetical protein
MATADTKEGVSVTAIFPGKVMSFADLAVELVDVRAFRFGLRGFAVPCLDVKVFDAAAAIVLGFGLNRPNPLCLACAEKDRHDAGEGLA